MGYYLYNGHYYYKSVAQKNIYGESAAYYFDDDTQIVNGETYWYSCDPIEWEIFSTNGNKKTLFATQILDFAVFYTNNSNNYKESSVRQFINGDFYNKAFSNGEIPIVTEVDNSVESTCASTNHYVCDNTFDKVFLPSAKDLRYGDVNNTTNAWRKRCVSEFARANKVMTYVDLSGYYLTRSPYYGDESKVIIVNRYGAMDEYGDKDNYFSICPMITIND